MIIFGFNIPDALVYGSAFLLLSGSNNEGHTIHTDGRIFSNLVSSSFNEKLTKAAKNISTPEATVDPNWLMANMKRESGLQNDAMLNRYIKKDENGRYLYKIKNGKPRPLYRYKSFTDISSFEFGKNITIEHEGKVYTFEDAVTIGGGLIGFMRDTAVALWKKKNITHINKTKALYDLLNMSPTDQLDFVELFYMPYKGKIKSITDLRILTFWPSALGKPGDYVIIDDSMNETYNANSKADLNKDGSITINEVSQKIIETYSEGLKQIKK